LKVPNWFLKRIVCTTSREGNIFNILANLRLILVEKMLEVLEWFFHLRLSIYLRRNLTQPSEGDFVFDVGASKGATSKIFLRLFPGINIIAFEPLPIFKVKSLKVEWIQKALAKTSGFADFYVCAHSPSSTLSLPSLESSWLQLKSKVLGINPDSLYEKISIDISTLDDIVARKRVGSIFLLKIDTEGTELEVLQGGLKSLSRGTIKNIQLESHSNDLRQNDREQIVNLLSSYNFVHKKTLKHYFGSFYEEIFTLNKNG